MNLMSKYSDEKIVQLIEASMRDRAETHEVEFKDARGGIPKDLWKTISAFSHRPDGGLIVFGIRENKESMDVVGGLDLGLLQEQVASYFNERMRNAERPEIKILSFRNERIIVIVVKEVPNENKPCFEMNIGLPNGACIRIGNTNRVINLEEMRQFIKNSSLFKFDRLKAPGATMDMLSEKKILGFLKKGAEKAGRPFSMTEIDYGILKNLNLAKDFDGVFSPTSGGFLIFARKPPQHLGDFSRYIIRCIRYSGVSPSSPIVDKADVEGTLDEQIDSVQKFILRNIPLTAEIVGTRRIERYEYPVEAIRELVANAVIHRDYCATETYTQISIYSNRLEVSNPGNLPPGVTIETIKESQFSRNEIIAGILKDMDYLEEYGRGIDIVFSRMSEEGLLEPVFKNISNSFKVTLLGRVFKDLNERQVRMWQVIQDKNRLNIRECILFFDGVSRATISNDLRKLIDLNLIKQMGSSNNIHYVPQY